MLFGIIVSAISEKETCIDNTDVARILYFTVRMVYCFKLSLGDYEEN